MRKAVIQWFDSHVDRNLTVRRFNISANRVLPETSLLYQENMQQLDLFTDYTNVNEKEEKLKADLEREKRLQQVTLTIKKKYGKNAVLKGMDLDEGATAKQRNETIGGHKA